MSVSMLSAGLAGSITTSGGKPGFAVQVGVWEAIHCGFLDQEGHESRIYKLINEEAHSITFKTKVFDPEHLKAVAEEFLQLHAAYAETEEAEFEAYLKDRPGTVMDLDLAAEYAAFQETEGFGNVAKAFRKAYRYAMQLPFEEICDLYTLFSLIGEDAFEETLPPPGDPEETFLSTWWDHLDDGLFAQEQEQLVEAMYGKSHDTLKRLMRMGAARCGIRLELK